MMKNTTHYLFFLEPYTFIFYQEKNKIIYNTLNGAYISCPESSIIDDMLQKLNNPTNGYCIRISEDIVKEPIVEAFINQVRDSFSGDLIKEKQNQKQPYIFKPTLFFNYVPEKLKGENIGLFGERILQNVNEVSFFLDNDCKQNCKHCNGYYKQTLHCTLFEGDVTLELHHYEEIIRQLSLNQVQRLNFVGGDWEKNEVLQSLLPLLSNSDMKKSFYLHYTKFSSNAIRLLQNDSCELVVILHPGFNNEELLENISLYENKNITWQFLVTSTQDLLSIEELNLPENIKIEIIPYYTNENLDFFKENVFIELEDILEFPVSKNVLFRRSILNESFFGKLYITPTGNVYANMNYPSLGNILQTPLKELVYKELYNSYSWLKIRDKEPCFSCINKLLCPSISNYELVMERENLCKIM